MRKIILSLSALSLWNPVPAAAQSCDPPGAAAEAGVTTTTALTSQITGLGLVLTKATGQISGHIDQLAIAIGKIIDGQVQNQSQITQQQEQTRINRDFLPSDAACQAVSVTQSASTTAVVAAKQQAAVQKNLHDWYAGSPNSPSSGGSASTVASLASYRANLYCSQDEVNAHKGNCKSVGQQADADVEPGKTLYNQDTLSTQQSMQAATDLIRNLTGPIAPPAPPPTTNDPSLLKLFLAWLSGVARQNLANDALTSSVGDRTPAADSTAFQQIFNAAQIPTKAPIPQQISRKQLFVLDTARRYENPLWYASLGTMQPAEVAKEQTRILALIASQNQRVDDKLEKIQNILAALLAQSNEQHQKELQVQIKN